jgi:hypothetical protein
LLLLVGLALEACATIGIFFCYWLHQFFVVGVTLLVTSGCLSSLGIVAVIYASLALSSGTSSSAVDPRS